MSAWNKEQLENMLEDVINALDLSDTALEKHGPEGTAPATLVRLVLEQKDREIRLLRRGFVDASRPAESAKTVPMDGSAAIRRERERQKAVEGWTPEHDDLWRDEELRLAATCYAAPTPVEDAVKLAFGIDARCIEYNVLGQLKFDHLKAAAEIERFAQERHASSLQMARELMDSSCKAAEEQQARAEASEARVRELEAKYEPR